MKKSVVHFVVLSVVSLLLICILCVRSASAAGPFDETCLNCHGTGTILSFETEPCPVCHGEGDVATTGTCSVCQGSGKTNVWKTCSGCGGDGEIRPNLIQKSRNGYGTLAGLDWVARVEGVFHNEEDIGTYGKVKSIVYTLMEDYTHFSSRTYFPPHEDIKVIIDTPEIAFGTDWTYAIYLYSVDDITCPDCYGSGGRSTLVTCSECNGIGTFDTSKVCSNCQGTGQITTETSNTCSVCSGRGYVTNWTNVSIIAIVVVGMLIGTSAVVAYTRRGRKQ